MPPQNVSERKFQFRTEEDGSLSLESAVYQALGRASVCWESMDGTGIFQSDDAHEVGEALLEKIHDELGPPGHRMGMATTRELLQEVATRMHMTQNSTKGNMLAYFCEEAIQKLDAHILDHRTVDSS